MALRMEPGQTYNSWMEFRQALDEHCEENKVFFNIGHAKTVEQANGLLKKPPYFSKRLKYASIILRCKHFGSYTSLSAGIRPKQRSYKVDCKAFISVSACRKGGYLIVRDSYHLHSHPCNESIYSSYPEVRRMSTAEKKMVGTLMDMGVPVSQIKTAIGRNVTPKDLHNARSHSKRVKVSEESDEGGHSSNSRRGRTYKNLLEGQGSSSKAVSDNEDERLKQMTDDSASPSPVKRARMEEQYLEDVEKVLSAESTEGQGYIQLEEIGVQAVGSSHSIEHSSLSGRSDKETSEDCDGLSELLAAAGVGSDSVVLTVNQGLKTEVNEEGESTSTDSAPKNSYTVTITLPEGEVTHTGTDLQQLLKGLPLDKIGALKSSGSTSGGVKTEEVSPNKLTKICEKCETYMSPLDGHNLCLQCLGPEHLSDQTCIHCKNMKPEQINIRRKQLVRQRMKALRDLQEKRLNRFSTMSDSDESASLFSTTRKSKRGRKPKTFGPEFTTAEGTGIKGRKTKNSRDLSYPLKTEPDDDDYDVPSLDFTSDDFDEVQKPVEAVNTPRFEHFLRQSVNLEDVSVEEDSDGVLHYRPSQHTISEFDKIMKTDSNSLPAFPREIRGQYILDERFESDFCADPPPIDPHGLTSHQKAIGKGLKKLVTNAAVQTRLAVYDQLFTRLGEGMADEALTILGELYGRVSQVTEISQEDLTNDLQAALDTIQALKDLLQELGILSDNAVNTAAHQRSLSVHSFNLARKAKTSTQQSSAPPLSTRGKFKPFSATKLLVSSVESKPQNLEQLTSSTSVSESPSKTQTELSGVSLPSHFMKQFVVVSSTGNDPSSSNMALNTIPSVQDTGEVSAEAAQAFLNVGEKGYTVSPIAVSGNLLQNFTAGKDNVIELHVMKDDGTGLLQAGEATIEEVIQTQTAEDLIASGHAYQLT